MGLPKIRTKVVHSESKDAWNVVGVDLGGKYKIARVPYFVIVNSAVLSEREKQVAFEHAVFISTCFNAAHYEEKNEHLGSSIYNNSHPYDDIHPKDLPF